MRDAGGGTAYVVYRRDRVACVRGADLLQRLKLKANSATTRVVATCCNSAMAMTFDDRRHWVPMYRARFQADAPPLQMRVATKFKPAGVELPTDVPSYPRFPPSFIGQLLAARLAMFLRR